MKSNKNIFWRFGLTSTIIAMLILVYLLFSKRSNVLEEQNDIGKKENVELKELRALLNLDKPQEIHFNFLSNHLIEVQKAMESKKSKLQNELNLYRDENNELILDSIMKLLQDQENDLNSIHKMYFDDLKEILEEEQWELYAKLWKENRIVF